MINWIKCTSNSMPEIEGIDYLIVSGSYLTDAYYNNGLFRPPNCNFPVYPTHWAKINLPEETE